MKSVKSFFLAGVAGLVSVAGVQAADMPVKAKPVQYVMICTLYGEGYYYIPGTDTCIKVGGYVRLDVVWHADGGRTPDYAGATGAQDRSLGDLTSRAVNQDPLHNRLPKRRPAIIPSIIRQYETIVCQCRWFASSPVLVASDIASQLPVSHEVWLQPETRSHGPALYSQVDGFGGPNGGDGGKVGNLIECSGTTRQIVRILCRFSALFFGAAHRCVPVKLEAFAPLPRP